MDKSETVPGVEVAGGEENCYLSAFETLFNSVSDAIILSDEAGRIYRTNSAFTVMFGYSAAEVMGRSINFLYTNQAEIEALTGSAGGVSETSTVSVRLKNGSICWSETSVVRMGRSETKSTCLHLHRYFGTEIAGEHASELTNGELEEKISERTVQLARSVELLQEEIGHRWQAQEAVQRSARQYQTLSETNQAIIRAIDRNSLFHEICRVLVYHGGFPMAWIGEVDYASRVVQPVAASGNGADDLLKMVISLDGEDFNPVTTAVRNGNCCITNDFTRGRYDSGATSGDFLAAASFALKLDGDVIGVLTIYAGEENFFAGTFVRLLERLSADISFALENLDREVRRREAEQALQAEVVERLRMIEELRRQEQLLLHQSRQAAMGEMIGNIAHQWRQPLNTLGLVVQELTLNYDIGLFDRAYLDRSVARAMKLIAHMSQTIDDFRNFFRPAKGKVEFRISQVVANAISLVEESFKSLQINVIVEECDDVVIISYPNEFAQVLLSILSNARDALIDTKPENPLVTIKLFKEKERAVVTVADNAGGVAEEIIENIFDPYFSTKGPEHGTGVGLFMAKSIVEKSMMGRLTVRNCRGGAEFRIEI